MCVCVCVCVCMSCAMEVEAQPPIYLPFVLSAFITSSKETPTDKRFFSMFGLLPPTGISIGWALSFVFTYALTHTLTHKHTHIQREREREREKERVRAATLTCTMTSVTHTHTHTQSQRDLYSHTAIHTYKNTRHWQTFKGWCRLRET